MALEPFPHTRAAAGRAFCNFEVEAVFKTGFPCRIENDAVGTVLRGAGHLPCLLRLEGLAGDLQLDQSVAGDGVDELLLNRFDQLLFEVRNLLTQPR